MLDDDVSKYVNENGNLEFPKYLYNSLKELMKYHLDLGTVVSDNPAKLRAYKEMVKTSFKQNWLDIARRLESFGLIERCTCGDKEFCTTCGGSRYLLDSYVFDADKITRTPTDPQDLLLREKLSAGLEQAKKMVKE